MGDQPVAQEIAQLWQEYEDAATPEALLVKDLDKFEMIVQALEYEKCMHMARTPCTWLHVLTVLLFYMPLADNKKLQSFFNSTKGKFTHPTVKAWAEALYAERKDHFGEKD